MRSCRNNCSTCRLISPSANAQASMTAAVVCRAAIVNVLALSQLLMHLSLPLPGNGTAAFTAALHRLWKRVRFGLPHAASTRFARKVRRTPGRIDPLKSLSHCARIKVCLVRHLSVGLLVIGTCGRNTGSRAKEFAVTVS